MDVRVARDRVPLCVQVYDQVLDAVRREGLGPGEQLPGEVSLAQDLRVSRTVLREALLLLEEDGHLVRNRGKRWTIATRRQESTGFADGLARLAGPGVVAERRLQAGYVDADAFTREYFGGEEPPLVWETVFGKDGAVVGSSLEFMAARAVPSRLSKDALAAAMDVTDSPATLLDALGEGRRSRMSPVLWRISAVSPRTERLSWMRLPRNAMPAVLTVGLAEGGVPVYVAKNLVDLSRFPLTVDLHRTQTIDHQQRDERFVELAGARID